jgi:hypothetical protein
MSDRWAEFGQVGKSRACTRGAHSDCAHFVTVGGGFNPRRLRLEFGAGLCPYVPLALPGRHREAADRAA